ncbi:MAG: CocE/NonD family hydrolase, partial [Caldilineaceae bacterium]
MNPMVDGWRGDDWFHNGAFREYSLGYIWEQIATRDNSVAYEMNEGDTYDHYMRGISAGALATEHGLDQIGFWQKIKAHPTYDAFWQAQAMDKILGTQPLKVPTMIVHSLWDQEDIYGAPAVYEAIEPKDAENDMVYLTMGPWYHGQQIGRAETLGALRWDSDTAKWWRLNVLAPFLAHYLYDRPMDVAPVTSFQSGSKRWQRLDRLPDPAMTKLWLRPDMSVGFAPIKNAATVEYVSDPNSPVTYEARPTRDVGYAGDNPWQTWLADDQRTVSARPDVLTFTGPVLEQALTITGRPIVHLKASTSGSDSDWVVKLIDVYPDQVPGDTDMGGYQLAVGMDIFRGRYRESLSQAKPLQPNTALKYEFALPMADHVFLPGHRIMVQIQSSWFPLYDRNPQTFVPSILDAKPGDYVKATQKITVGGADGTYIDMPVIH